MATARKKKDKPDVVIPEKLYFRIGEVSRLSELPAHVLRFWESEFPQLKPTKSSSGQRMYRRREVEFVLATKLHAFVDETESGVGLDAAKLDPFDAGALQ